MVGTILRMKRRSRLVVALLVALVVLPVFAWYLNGWAYARWSDKVIAIAHQLERSDPVKFEVEPDYIKVNRHGDVELYFEPPRTAWLVRLTDPDHGMTAYVITISSRPGAKRVDIDHGLD